MAIEPKPHRRAERFTMLEGKEPGNLTSEQKAWPSVELDDLLPSERFTMLEGKEPSNLTGEPEEGPAVG